MGKKIGIATLYTGFNFGSSLQAYAVKTLVEESGYKAEIWKVKGSFIKGRDIRLKKLFAMLFRAIFVKNGLKQLKNYQNGYAKKFGNGSKERFAKFTDEFLSVKTLSYSQMRELAKKQEYKAFVCGSDQIWSATTLYVDPVYYLRFAPQEKRIAIAPSFGKESIPPYNQKKIKKYISQIPHKSVREISGAKIINGLIGEDVPVLFDPTLLLDKNTWLKKFDTSNKQKIPYVLAYFLDKPSEKAMKNILEIAEKYHLKILNIPYDFSNNGEFVQDVGPCEFLSLIANASFVCTDSFHGTAFSLNFNIPFYTFERNYGLAEKQSTRISSLLNKMNMLNRYEPQTMQDIFGISFQKTNEILQIEREKARGYIEESLREIENKRIRIE